MDSLSINNSISSCASVCVTFLIKVSGGGGVAGVLTLTFGNCLTGIKTFWPSFMFLLMTTSMNFSSSFPSSFWFFSISGKRMRNRSAVAKRQKSDASMMWSTVKSELLPSIKLLKTNILHYIHTQYVCVCVCVGGGGRRVTRVAPPDCHKYCLSHVRRWCIWRRNLEGLIRRITSMFRRQENGFTGRAAQGSEASEGRLRESNLHPRDSFRGFLYIYIHVYGQNWDENWDDLALNFV